MNASALTFLALGWGIIIFFVVVSMSKILKESK